MPIRHLHRRSLEVIAAVPEPGGQMSRGDPPQAANDGSFESVRESLFEGSEPMLQEAPARLNGTEVGRIRWQEQQARLGAFDQPADFGRVVGTQVVEYDDVARVEARDQSFADKFDKLWTVDGSVE